MGIAAAKFGMGRSAARPLMSLGAAAHLPPAAYRDKFTGKYEHRTLTGGIGHNLPQEAPQAFAKAIIDVDGFVA